jgi:predicted RNA-binding protein with PUA domain
VEKHFRCGERLNGVAVFLNKVAGEDRVDEVIVQGRTIAVLRFDVQRQELLLDLKEDGALLLFMARGAVRCWRAGQLVTVIPEIPDERETRFNDVLADPAGRQRIRHRGHRIDQGAL